ncbi:hypothetical protein DXC08_05910 [Clostridium sp. OM07-9AC]|nr:hypothetical protein DXC08_05910 [Clostridium sp. OM07-9AC]
MPLNLPKWRKEENFTNNIAFVGDKIYLVEMNNKIFELDPRNGKLKSFCSDEDGNVRGVFAAGQDVAIVRTDSTVVFADSKTGTIREENKKLQRIFENLDGGNQDNSFPVNFSANEKNETVIVCHKGIFFVKTTGGAVEQILNGDIVSSVMEVCILSLSSSLMPEIIWSLPWIPWGMINACIIIMIRTLPQYRQSRLQCTL